MKNIKLAFAHMLLFGMLIPVGANSQSMEDVEKNYTLLTEEWLKISYQLKSYEGLSEYCKDPSAKNRTSYVLSTLHHYDSVLLSLMEDPTLNIDHKEYKKTVKEIEGFETKYSVKKTNEMLSESCLERRSLERDKEDLAKDIGIYSYDGQVLNLETMLQRYLNHIDKKIVDIEEHLHVIQPHHFKPFVVELAQQDE